MSHIHTTLIGLLVLTASIARADDWPQWGGPQRDLVWREDGIVESLPVDADGQLPRMWSTPIGEGYTGPAVADGRAFVTDRITDDSLERVLCLDAETGKVLWRHDYRARYTVSYPAGPRSTPVVDGNRAYTIGAVGHMFCLEVESGKVLWQKNFVDDYGTTLPIWGMVASPLVDGDQLITLVGGNDGALVVSFNKHTGREIWRSLNSPAIGYAPPVIFEFGGQRQLIVWHPEAVSAINPENGKLIWEVPYRVRSGLSIATPRKVQNRLFVASFYNGPRMLEVADDGQSARIVWSGKSDNEIRTDGVHPIMCTPWFDGENIFSVCSYGQLRGLNARTGERLWETRKATGEGRWWNAFLVPHKDRFFIHNEQGELIIARLSADGYEELSRGLLVEPTRPVRRRMTIWSHPAFAMKSVFARNDRELVRVSLAAGTDRSLGNQ